MTRLRTRYGTGVIAEDGEGHVAASVIASFREPRQRVHFLGDVKPDGAPRNTAPAAHAARAAELVTPRTYLVGQPLPVRDAPDCRTLPSCTNVKSNS